MRKEIYAGLVSLSLTGQVNAQSPIATQSYIFSRGSDDLKREELLVPGKGFDIYFTKQGDFVKFRLQRLWDVGDLELGIAAHPETGGNEGVGLAVRYKKKGDGSFRLLDARYFPSRDWIDVFTTVSKGDFSLDLLAAHYHDSDRSWARVGVDKKLGKNWVVGYEAKFNRQFNQWKKQYHGPRVRFTRRF